MNSIWFVVIVLVGIAAYIATVYAIMSAIFRLKAWLTERKNNQLKKGDSNAKNHV